MGIFFDEFSSCPFVGASGGILTLWDVSEVEVSVTRSFDNVLTIQDMFIKSGNELSIANVYASADIIGRKLLWMRLSGLINNNKETN